MNDATTVRGGTRRPARARRNSCDEHLTYTAGCSACQARNRDSRRRRTRLKAYGQWDSGMVDTTPAREHIRYLNQAHHMSLRAISDTAGVSHSSLDLIASGQRTRAAQYTVDAICGVKPSTPTNPLRRVPAHGTARRLQALTAAGYDTPHLCVLLNARPTDIQRWRRMASPEVSAATHRRVAALCAQIGGKFGPSAAARRKGARYRWALLAEWNDIDRADDQPALPVDDPDTVDALVVERAARGSIPLGRLTEPEKPHLYRLWCQQRAAVGKPHGTKPFARAFNVTEWQARQIGRAAAALQTDPIPAADSRTNRKVA